MEKTQIITIVSAIIVGIVSAFSKSMFDKILSKYDPDVKSITSGIKKFFNFIFSYVLPIIALILLYLKYDKIDKILILSTAFLFSVLVFNVLFSILKSIIEILKLTSDKELFENIVSAIKANYEISTEQNEVIKGLVKDHQSHLKITDSLLTISEKTSAETKKPNH